jgi:preprotein translocase subunit SecD
MRTSRWVVWTYTIIILAGIIAALPNVLTAKQLAALPSWFPKQQVTLGLDLQGGSHLVLEVDAAALKHRPPPLAARRCARRPAQGAHRRIFGAACR